jgi:hypothetical protein
MAGLLNASVTRQPCGRKPWLIRHLSHQQFELESCLFAAGSARRRHEQEP